MNRRARRRKWPAIQKAIDQVDGINPGDVVPPPPSPSWQWWWDEPGARWVRHDPRVIAWVQALVDCPDDDYLTDIAARIENPPTASTPTTV